MIDHRGETILEGLSEYKQETQVFIMHSPKVRSETIAEGRLMHTSNQPDGMNAMREKLLHRILGAIPKTMSIGEQDEIVKRWWQEQLKQWDGIVVDWDPDDNRNGLNNSVELFIARHIKPDVLIPRPVSRFTQRQLESIFDALPNIDDFLRRILP